MKVGLYDKKNQEASRFWQNTDLTNRQSKCLLFGEGLQVVVDDIAESMKGVADEVVESVLENIVMEMARDMACEVCFEEDAPDVWEFQRQGST